MVRRIVVTDGDWSGDTIQYVTRQAAPQAISGLAEGDYHLTNTRTREGSYGVPGAPAELQLEATITPDPLVAGEEFVVDFNTVPDAVSPVSLVQDPLDPTRYTGTAPDNGIRAIGATKAGWQAFAEIYEYAPLPAAPTGSIVQRSDGKLGITLPDSVSQPFDAQIEIDRNGVKTTRTITIDPAACTPQAKPIIADAVDIDGQGGDDKVLTVTNHAIFAGHKDAGAITLSGGWYRGDTANGDTDGSYTQDDAVDGDKTLTARDTATNTAGATVAVSNGILCPAPAPQPGADWWDPRSSVDIDYQNNRARIGGVSYASIAAARTAGKIVVDANGSDRVPGLSAVPCVVGIKGIMPAAAADDTMIVCLDDGDDGAPDDHQAAITQRQDNATPRLYPAMRAAGATYFGVIGILAPFGSLFRAALRVHPTAYGFAANGTLRTGVNTPSPAVTQLVIKNRSDGTKPWPGTLHRVTYIPTTLPDADTTALMA